MPNEIPIIGLLKPKQLDKLTKDLNALINRYFKQQTVACLYVATRTGVYAIGMPRSDAARFAVACGKDLAKEGGIVLTETEKVKP